MAAGGCVTVEGLFEKNEKERLRCFTSSSKDDGIKYTGTEKPILAMLNEFRKDEKTGFCDVIIQVEGVELPAHRCILAANSQLFYNMFNSGMRESGERVLKLQSVSCAAMSSLLEYFYTREITISEESLEDILDAANFLLVKPVQQACIQVLNDKLGNSNCFTLKHLAQKYDASELLDKADHFTKKNFSRVSRESEEFVGISSEELSGLISSDEIMVESEEDVYFAVMKWINYDIANRKEFLAQLLSQLRCGSLTKSFIRGQLLNEPLVKNCAASRNVLEMWIKVKTKKKKTKGHKAHPVRPSTKPHDVVVTFEDAEFHDCTGFDVNTQETIHLPYLPRHQAYPRVAVINQTVFIIGGQRECTLDEVSQVSSLSLTSGSNQSLAWEKKASFSEKRSAFAVSVLGKYIYLLGGINPTHSILVGTVERYNSDVDAWETVSSLQEARCNLSSVGMHNFVLAIGGCVGSDKRSSAVVEKYNPCQNSWVQMAPLHIARRSPHAVCFGNKVYVMGGSSSNGQYQNSCEVYTARPNEWNLITNFQKPSEQIGFTQLVGTFPVNDVLHACFADDLQDKVKVLRLNSQSCMLEKPEQMPEIMPSTCHSPYKAFVIQVPKFHLELLPAVDETYTMGDDDSYGDFHDDYSDFFDDYMYDDYDEDIDDDDYYDDWGDDADWGGDPDWLL